MNKSLHILIVEDDADIVEYTTTLLETFIDGKIGSVNNSEAAIEYVKKYSPDIVLMDIILFGALDGIQTAQEIRKNSNVPIIYTTGHNDEYFLKKAKITNPFGYLTKPIEVRDLQAVITITMQQYEQQKLLQRNTYITQSLQKIYHPLLITNKDGKLTSINEAAQKLFSVEEKVVLGNSIKEYLKITVKHINLDFDEEIIKAKRNNGLYKEEELVALTLPNGSVLPISLTFSLVHGAFETLDGVSVMIVDLTQQVMEKNLLHQKQLEAAELLIRERRLKSILDIGKDINQFLLPMSPLQTRLENVLNTIVTFASFKLAHIALLEGEQLRSKVMSRNGFLYLNYEDVIPNNDHSTKQFYRSLKEQKIVILEVSKSTMPTLYNERVKNLHLRTVLLLPLQNIHTHEPLGILSIASDNEMTFDIDVINYFEEFASDISLAITLQNHRDEMKKIKEEREQNYEQTILSFVQMIEERDIYTKGHSLRVATYAQEIARNMGLSEQNCNEIFTAGILHDIGKIQTPDKILLKPAKLNKDEFSMVQEHVSAGIRMIEHIELYKGLLQTVEEHHERYDGSGYPHGLKGNNISMMGRIMAVADAFDAMTTNRVYHKRLSIEDALQELREYSGSQFDPDVVKASCTVLNNRNAPDIDQLQDSHLIYERMAYFFSDPLSTMFNEKYFKYFLRTKNEELASKQVCVYRISGLDAYNNSKSWCAGNEIILATANLIKKEMKTPSNIFFRLHGNKFLILSDKKENLKEKKVLFDELYKGTNLEARIECYDQEIFQNNSAQEYESLIHTLVC
mgnify:FL=1